MCSLCSILGIRWQDRITDLEVLDHANFNNIHCVQTYYANAKFSVKIKIPLQNTTFGKVIGFKYYSLYVHLQMKFSTSNYFLQITIILSSLHSVCFLLSRDIMQHSNNKCAVQSYFIIFSRL